MIGRNKYCEYAIRFHGKPVNKCPLIYSTTTHIEGASIRAAFKPIFFLAHENTKPKSPKNNAKYDARRMFSKNEIKKCRLPYFVIVYVIQYIVTVKKTTPIRNDMRKLLPGDFSLILKSQTVRQNQEMKNSFGNMKEADNKTTDKTIELTISMVFFLIKFRIV
jgi:hypothetical protein